MPQTDPYAAYGGHAAPQQAQPASVGADPYAAYGGHAAPSSNPQPAESSLTANPSSEGVYRMNGPNGSAGIPFSNVYRAQQSGYKLDPSDEGRFNKDWAAAPGQRNTIAPSSPSFLDRVRNTVANSAVGHSVEQVMPKVADALNLHPTETVNSPTYSSDRQQLIAPQYLMPRNPQGHVAGIAKGALTGTGKLTSGNSLATTAALAATGGLVAPLAPAAALLKYGGGTYGLYGAGKDLYGAGKSYLLGDSRQGDEQLGEALPNAALLLPSAAKPMERVGEAMQTGGESLINSTVGARKAEFRRGANPGEGYFQSGFGPSLSMRSIANKAEGAREATGEEIGDIAERYRKAGTLIPYVEGAAPILRAIAHTRAQLSGPGGTGDTNALDAFESTWRPLLQDAQHNGGFDPVEYAAAKRNTAKNTTWGDATQAGMKDMRQSTVGGMGGAMVKTIPELELPNSKYQNLTSLARVASDRATTGQRPLTEIGRKLLLGGLGAGSGLVTHESIAPFLTGAAGLAIDSVPVKTTAASGLYYGGKGLVGAGRWLGSLLPTARIPLDDAFNDNVDEDGRQGTTDNQKGFHNAPPAPYGLRNLMPEIVRPDAQSRSRIPVGPSGRDGVLIRPLGRLLAPQPLMPQAAPYEFTPKPISAVPSPNEARLSRELGSRASLIPSNLKRDITSPGTPEAKAAALRQARLGSYGSIVPSRLFSEPEVIPPAPKPASRPATGDGSLLSMRKKWTR